MMHARINPLLAVKPVNLSDPKRLKRLEWLRKVEATMIDELDGAQPWEAGLYYKRALYPIRDLKDMIADLKDLQTRKGLNLKQERNLLVYERGLWAVQSRNRIRNMEARSRK